MLIMYQTCYTPTTSLHASNYATYAAYLQIFTLYVLGALIVMRYAYGSSVTRPKLICLSPHIWRSGPYAHDLGLVVPISPVSCSGGCSPPFLFVSWLSAVVSINQSTMLRRFYTWLSSTVQQYTVCFNIKSYMRKCKSNINTYMNQTIR